MRLLGYTRVSTPAQDAQLQLDALATAGAGLVPDIDDHRGAASWAEQEVADEPRLEMAATTTYGWGRTLPVPDYLNLLTTTSQYAIADVVVRRQLFDSLTPVLGETVELTGRTVLLTVRRRRTDS